MFPAFPAISAREKENGMVSHMEVIAHQEAVRLMNRIANPDIRARARRSHRGTD